MKKEKLYIHINLEMSQKIYEANPALIAELEAAMQKEIAPYLKKVAAQLVPDFNKCTEYVFQVKAMPNPQIHGGVDWHYLDFTLNFVPQCLLPFISRRIDYLLKTQFAMLGRQDMQPQPGCKVIVTCANAAKKEYAWGSAVSDVVFRALYRVNSNLGPGEVLAEFKEGKTFKVEVQVPPALKEQKLTAEEIDEIKTILEQPMPRLLTGALGGRRFGGSVVHFNDVDFDISF